MIQGTFFANFLCKESALFISPCTFLSPLLASRGVPATTIAILSYGSRAYIEDSSEQKEMVQEQERKGEEEGGDDGSYLLLWLIVAVCATTIYACITAFLTYRNC